MIVGFTGTRQGMSTSQREFLAEIFIALKVSKLHHGCCIGADDQANTIARSLGIKTEGHPHIITDKMARCVVDIIHQPKDYIPRNHEIVDAVSILLVAPLTRTEVKQGSGTWATYRYANQTGKNVIILSR